MAKKFWIVVYDGEYIRDMYIIANEVKKVDEKTLEADGVIIGLYTVGEIDEIDAGEDYEEEEEE